MTRWMRQSAYLVAGLVLILVAYWVRVVLVPFLLAAFLSYLLEPAVVHLERRGFGRVRGILVLYLALVVALVFMGLMLIPALLQELNRLADLVPEYAEMLRQRLAHLQSDYSRLPVPDNVRNLLDEAVADTEGRMLGAISTAVMGTFGLIGGVVRLLLTPVLAYYMLRDLPGLKEQVGQLMEPHPHWRQCLGQVDQVVGGFVRAQFIVGLIVGSLTVVALALLGVRFALLIGLLAFIGEFIPYFGPIVSALAAIGVALLMSPIKAVQVALAMVLIQQVESGIIAPKIVGDRTGLHPLTVIFLVLTGGYLFGLWGLLLAVPVGAVVKVGAACIWGMQQGGRISPD